MDSGKVTADAEVALRVEQRGAPPKVMVRSLALVPDRVPLYRGYPLTPKAWVNGAGYVSLKRATITGRPSPGEVRVGSDFRYLPTDETQTFYTKQHEAIMRSFQRIENDTVQLGPPSGRLAALTVSAVVHVLAQGKILDSPTLSWVANDKLDALYGGDGEGIPTVTTRHPLIVTSVITGPTCTTTVESRSSTVVAKQDMLPALGFSMCGDIRLFELNLWTRALAPSEVTAHHAAMTMIYGSDLT